MQTNDPNQNQQTQPKEPKNQKTLIYILITLIILSLGASGFLFYQNQQLKQQLFRIKKPSLIASSPKPTQKPTPSIAPPIPTGTSEKEPEASEGWSIYTQKKIVDYFNAFKLYYPKAWKLETSSSDNPKTSQITLRKQDSIISILQGPGSMASCLYPEDPNLDGMYARHGDYKEIIKKNGIIWRIALPENYDLNKPNYIVCQKKPGEDFFTGSTSVGFFTALIPNEDSQTLNEVYEMLEKIEIIE